MSVTAQNIIIWNMESNDFAGRIQGSFKLPNPFAILETSILYLQQNTLFSYDFETKKGEKWVDGTFNEVYTCNPV